MVNLLELRSSSLWVRVPLHTDPTVKHKERSEAIHAVREKKMNVVVYQCSVVSFLAACGDLIAAVFDFAHDMCTLKLTEQQIALFSALVLINAGMISSPMSLLVLHFILWF